MRQYPSLDREYKVSVGGGVEPVWSSAGNELFFRNGNQWMATTVSTEPTFRTSAPRELFQVKFVDTGGVSYDVAPDGRFLILAPIAPASDPTEVGIVLNWFEELKPLAPRN